MRMSSAVKKVDKGRVNSSAPVLSKEAVNQNLVKPVSKPVEIKSADSSKAADVNPKVLPTAEQLRIAQMISDSNKDDPQLPDRVNKIVELTNCSADAAIIALHDANNDLDQAVAALLDGETEGDWEVSGKKKKVKQQPQSQVSGTAAEADVGNGGNGVAAGRGREWNRDRDRSRSSRGPPPRMRGRGRGRDNKENFDGVETGSAAVVDGEFSASRGRGYRSGPSRTSNGPGSSSREGGWSSSGGRGGGRGGRGYRRGGRPAPQSSAEVWDDGANSVMNKVEPWGVDFPSAEDWDNEEYIGSLVETKVFTPSQSAAATTVGAQPVPPSVDEMAPLLNGSTTPTATAAAAAAASPVSMAAAPLPAAVMEVAPPAAASTAVLYSAVSNSSQQVIDLKALLQNTTAVTIPGGPPSVQQQQYLHYAQATDALADMKAAMGVAASAAAGGAPAANQQAQKLRTQRAKIPPPSKIPSSAVEMPDDPVSGLDVKFGTLDFGIEPSGFDIGLDSSLNATVAAANCSVQAESQHQQQQQLQPQQQHQQHQHAQSQSQQQQSHGLMQKMDQYAGGSVSGAQQQPPAASALPKPDVSALGSFSSSVAPSASPMVTSASQIKAAASSAASYPYGAVYAPAAVNSTSGSSATCGGGGGAAQQPAGAYPSSSQQTSAGGVYSNSGPASSYQVGNSQAVYGNYAQQQQQQVSSYQTYNKMNAGAVATGLSDGSGASSVSSLRADLSGVAGASPTQRVPVTTASAAVNVNKAAGAAALAPVSSSMPNLPPGVPTMLGPGGFIMGQAPGLPYYAAAAAAGLQQHPVYSLEEMQFRYPHLAAGYYDMGYQSPTSLSTGREGTLASLAYASSDAKFPRNENNSPVPTSLSQNAAQSHGGAFITPAPAAATALPPAYAYYYSGGVMPGGYQFGAPAALYPVSAAASGHAGSGAGGQYGKGGPLGGGGGGTGAAQSGQAAGGNAGAGGSSTGTASYANYGSAYDDFSKSVYGSVGVGSAAGQAAKIGGVGASAGPSGVGAAGSADLGVGQAVYGKSHSQLGKISTYDKAGGFHTGTPPPYGLPGNAAGTPLGVGVSVGVGVGGPSPYGAQHMFIPTLAPHQSQHSHLMHQQLHQDSASGPGQRSQSGGQQNKQGSKPSYGGGSYWGNN